MATAPIDRVIPSSTEWQGAVEEFKELGHEYRYREQILVQEFSLTMVAIAGLLNVLLRHPRPDFWQALILQVFGVAVLVVLAFHLRNVNQDRLAVLHRKTEIGDRLGFARANQNVGGKKRWFKGPLAIVLLTATTAVSWTVWTIYSAASHIQEIKTALLHFFP